MSRKVCHVTMCICEMCVVHEEVFLSAFLMISCHIYVPGCAFLTYEKLESALRAVEDVHDKISLPPVRGHVAVNRLRSDE